MFISSMKMKAGNTRSKRPLNFTFDRALTVCFMHQVVVASFQPEQQKPKKQRTDYTSLPAPPTSSHINNHVSAEQLKPIMSPAGFNFASFGNGQGSGNSSSSSDDEHV
jgi:hypothetical protein